MTMINEGSLETEQIITYAPSISTLELPRLFYPVSYLGAVKLDFMEKLADALGASFVDREAVVGRSFRGQIAELPRSAGKTAKKLLEIGDDVVLNENQNGSDDRTNLTKIARATGATTICLSIMSSEEVASRRVNQWVDEGVLQVPKSGLHPLDVMQKGSEKHQIPTQGEADYIIELDGTLGTTNLLDRVFEQLERHALMDEALSRMDPRGLAS
jgi:hypothetical protein